MWAGLLVVAMNSAIFDEHGPAPWTSCPRGHGADSKRGSATNEEGTKIEPSRVQPLLARGPVCFLPRQEPCLDGAPEFPFDIIKVSNNHPSAEETEGPGPSSVSRLLARYAAYWPTEGIS